MYELLSYCNCLIVSSKLACERMWNFNRNLEGHLHKLPKIFNIPISWVNLNDITSLFMSDLFSFCNSLTVSCKETCKKRYNFDNEMQEKEAEFTSLSWLKI